MKTKNIRQHSSSRIHIQKTGFGSPLVLFHGWGFDSSIWRSLLPELSESFELYLIDLPGFGLSAPMHWETFKTLLLAQLPKHFALAGWSMGGLVATRLALEVPLRVSHLFNIATSPRFIRDSNWPGVEQQVFITFYKNLLANPENTLNEFLALQLPSEKMDTSTLAPKHKPTMAGLKSGLEWLLNWDLRDQLEQLQMPVCYLFGRLDAITPRTTCAVMKKSYPQFEYKILPTAAHAPFLSHAQDFMAALQNFIK